MVLRNGVSAVAAFSVLLIGARAAEAAFPVISNSQAQLGALLGVMFAGLPFLYKFIDRQMIRVTGGVRKPGPSRMVTVLTACAWITGIAQGLGFILGVLATIGYYASGAGDDLEAFTTGLFWAMQPIIWLVLFGVGIRLGFYIARRHEAPAKAVAWAAAGMCALANMTINIFSIMTSESVRTMLVGGSDAFSPEVIIAMPFGAVLFGVPLALAMLLGMRFQRRRAVAAALSDSAHGHGAVIG